jgi:hypothetical protein
MPSRSTQSLAIHIAISRLIQNAIDGADGNSSLGTAGAAV